jgi:hypothetical protein
MLTYDTTSEIWKKKKKKQLVATLPNEQIKTHDLNPKLNPKPNPNPKHLFTSKFHMEAMSTQHHGPSSLLPTST